MKTALTLVLASSAALLGTPAFCETTSFAYDAQGRLVASVHDQGTTATATSAYWLDAAGNRTKLATVSSSTTVIPIFRFAKANGQHFYTASFLEGQSAGLAKEGNAFSLFRQGGSGMTAIYRCYLATAGHHFLSVDSNCEGTTVEGLLGFVQAASGSGVVPLYRFYKSSNGDHLITTDYQAGVSGGYTLEGNYEYVPAS